MAGATDATGARVMWGAGSFLTMRTLPSASVISSSEMLDSETKSISVFSFLKSMGIGFIFQKRGANLTQKSG